MSNLIPTPRTDKLGRTITRHMKPAADTSTRSAIPTVRALTEQIAARRFVKQQLLDTQNLATFIVPVIIDFVSDKEIDTAIEMMQEVNPLLLVRARRFMTTGNDVAMTDASQFFLRAAHTLVYEVHKMPTVGNRKWTNNRLPDALDPMMLNEMSIRWSTLMLLDELKREHDKWQDDEDCIIWTKSTYSVAEMNPKEEPTPRDDWYWRGLSVLGLVQLATEHEVFYSERDRIAQVNGFIEYAGKHEDVRKVMDFAIERDLIDADALRSLVEQGKQGSSSLREGIL